MLSGGGWWWCRMVATFCHMVGPPFFPTSTTCDAAKTLDFQKCPPGSDQHFRSEEGTSLSHGWQKNVGWRVAFFGISATCDAAKTLTFQSDLVGSDMLVIQGPVGDSHFKCVCVVCCFSRGVRSNTTSLSYSVVSTMVCTIINHYLNCSRVFKSWSSCCIKKRIYYWT